MVVNQNENFISWPVTPSQETFMGKTMLMIMNYQRIDARTGFIYAHLSLKGILVQLADTTHAR